MCGQYYLFDLLLDAYRGERLDISKVSYQNLSFYKKNIQYYSLNARTRRGIEVFFSLDTLQYCSINICVRSCDIGT